MKRERTNYIQKAFDITKENMILAQPLVIYMLVLSFTLAGLGTQSNPALRLVFLTTNILLATAFFAGWFSMIRQGIFLNKKIENGEFKNAEDRMKASWDLGKTFFPGVGDNFLNVTSTSILFIISFLVITYLFYKLGTNFLPNPNLDLNKMYAAANSTTAELQKYLLSLSIDQIKAINLWGLYISGIVSAFTFATMFLFPAIFTNNKEEKEFFLLVPFTAFARNVVFLFKNILGSIGIFVFLFSLNTIFSILSLIFNLNIFLSIVGLILSFYVMTYAMVLIFLYYEEKN